MKKKYAIILGTGCYLLSFILIIIYLFLEFAILNVTSLKNRLVIILVIVLLQYLTVFFTKKAEYNYKKLMRINLWIWFTLYIIMVLNVTLFDQYFGRNYASYNLVMPYDAERVRYRFFTKANLVPFKTIINFCKSISKGIITKDYFARNIFGNLIAFMPLAFFLPRLFKKSKWYFNFIIVSLFIFFIEIMQFVLNSGSCDIDDYILNIVGMIFMYILINNKYIYKFISKLLFLD